MESRNLCLLVLVVAGTFYEALAYHYHTKHKIDYGGPRLAKRTKPCDRSEKYRTFDGTCHNLDHPSWGQSGATFRRLLPAKYEHNSAGTPRLTTKRGTSLPNPRTISTIVHDPLHRPAPGLSMMIMQWGQFLDHDLTLTPTQKPPEEGCCSDALVTGNKLHSDVKSGGPCNPIIVPRGDDYFTTTSSRCMEFHRSAPSMENGKRQQHNRQTAWIDGSQIYGYSDSQAKELRTTNGNGKLKVKKIGNEDFLPEDLKADKENECFIQGPNDYCFLVGDPRVMAYPGLGALQTVFLRYHNKLVDKLKAKHSSWSGDKLFQEARRINIAVLQKITYDEFLPALLGSSNADSYKLTSSSKFTYNNSIDGTLPNVFASAAYRFGHSMISDSLTINGHKIETGKLYNRAKYLLDDMKGLLTAIMGEPAERVDRWYSKGTTNKLFEKPGKPRTGFDLAARNIARGRDHGLPSYNDWRAYCNLPKLTSFNQMIPQNKRNFSNVYAFPDDIDLYTGGVSEINPTLGVAVGELYVCLLGKTFHDIKFGDRFWYQNTADSVTSFTKAQVDDINRISLAKVLCDTVPGITNLPRQVFHSGTRGPNRSVSCSQMRDLTFTSNRRFQSPW